MGGTTNYRVLSGFSLCHCLNDTVQSLLVPIYPLLKGDFDLSFAEIGFITLTYQFLASILQPLVGIYADKRPQPFALPVGMAFSLAGLLTLAFATSYALVLAGAALLGTGSSIFHPESSRLVRMAAGGRFGTAQSIFQLGGNVGSSVGPLLATLVGLGGRSYLSFFAVIPVIAIVILYRLSLWARVQAMRLKKLSRANTAEPATRSVVVTMLSVITLLIFSKSFYTTSISTYLIFYLQEQFGFSVQSGQLYLFAFLVAVAAGGVIGGPLSDRIGYRNIIWISILGAAPFTLLLPHAGPAMSLVLLIVIGMVMSSSFSAMIVLAQEILPTHVGMVAGLFFGLSFGAGGLGAAILGQVADTHGLPFVYNLCAWLPFIGILAIFLPRGQAGKTRTGKA